MSGARIEPETLARGVARQGVLLFSGFAAAQACSFARNALIGHTLSRGDFGIAATITLVLQLLETLSDGGADRLIVQDRNGDSPALCGSVHAVMVARGLVLALLLYFGAGPTAAFFDVPQAAWTFQTMAIVPLLRGFMSFDSRRAQRHLDNRALVAVDLLPQVAALIATLPILAFDASYASVVWLTLVQAVFALATSHIIAKRSYTLALDRASVQRLVTFGWPIWVSAFPLLAVMQADRVIVGRFLGMEALAGFTAAFLVTMVPSLLAVKIGHALLLPLLAGVQSRPETFQARFGVTCEAAALAAAAYLTLFLCAGGAMIAVAFGPNYQGLHTVAGWFALMWALRMVQVVPGLALMALGKTRPLLAAGLLRASSLGLALGAAFAGLGLEAIVAAGVLGEAISLGYIVARAEREARGLARVFLSRCLALLPIGIGALGVQTLGLASGPLAAIALAVALSALVTGVLVGAMPGLRAGVAAILAPGAALVRA